MAEKKGFATWYGTGPDKWASVWLLNRFVSPESPVELFPDGYIDDKYLYFDIPGTELNRDAHETSFAKLLAYYSVEDTRAAFIHRILHDIDIRLWQGHLEPFSEVAESGYRALQSKAGRDGVHPNCYMAFFDKVAEFAHLSEQDKRKIDASQLFPEAGCQKVGPATMFSSFVVPELSISDVLQKMRSGANVLFVDVREVEEYTAGHIPGAVNIKIRDVDAESVSKIAAADLIIPYCVKDFRGYEMAKKLKQFGIYNVALMNPFGLKGWLHSGLPLSYGIEATTATAEDALTFCIEGSARCEHAQ